MTLPNYENLRLEDLNYASYLKIPELLSLQQRISDPPHHDEMFFIIIHQAMELWFKEILFETEILVDAFQRGIVSRALKVLRRTTAIMDLLIRQINLLTTLTPVEFSGFRDNLRPASGFQSIQFRKMEFIYGIREPFFLKFFQALPEVLKELESIQSQPSVYDHFLKCLDQAGYLLPPEVLKRDFCAPRTPSSEVIQVLKRIYEDPKDQYHWVLLFEVLLDFDEKFVLWKNTHILMVERAIGHKKGTGGSEGYNFLKSRLELKFFPELWEVRNYIGGKY
ncbi:MAG: tryptophan 2,3-dioxygenase family protein [Planctomycetota bacterium]